LNQGSKLLKEFLRQAENNDMTQSRRESGSDSPQSPNED
jgi:hypothetical protein